MSASPSPLCRYAALNKLLGRPVYTSHMQLGGPRVMGVNGVSHHIVSDDLDGVRTLLQLLAFCPPGLGGNSASGWGGAGGGGMSGSATSAGGALVSHPVLPTHDPVERLVGYLPGARNVTLPVLCLLWPAF